MEEWKEYRLGEIAIPVKDRIDTSTLDKSSYISTENMLPNKEGISLSSGIPSGNAIKFINKDVLISNIRPYFKKIWQANKTGGCSGDVICFRATQIIEPIFLFYLLSQDSFFEYVMKGSKGTKMPRGDKSQIIKWTVLLPPYQEQKKISSFLKSLDDKIELNKRINDNLEQQAQALFKHWFVDFGPFKNSEFVESELGMIPKGWSVGRLGELLEIKYGKDHKKLSEGLYPVYGSGGLMRMVDKKLFEGESVLIPRKGTLNNVMYVNEAFWTVDTMFYSIPKVDNVILYSYIFLSFKDLSSMNAGSAVPSMTTEILNNMQIVIPTKDVLFEFNVIVSSYYSQINQKEKESRHLATLRDTLLPKLMSGQIKL